MWILIVKVVFNKYSYINLFTHNWVQIYTVWLYMDVICTTEQNQFQAYFVTLNTSCTKHSYPFTSLVCKALNFLGFSLSLSFSSPSELKFPILHYQINIQLFPWILNKHTKSGFSITLKLFPFLPTAIHSFFS